MSRRSRCRAPLALALACLGAPALALDADPGKYRRPAAFTVTDEVVTDDLGPFTATVTVMGNRLVNQPFEPRCYRTQFFAEGDADDRIPLSRKTLSGYDTLREGFYDGAEVQIFRIIDGRMRLVRQDTVPPGGSAMSGWDLATGDGALAPHRDGGGSHVHVFNDWNRQDVPSWFTVAAVSADGAVSEQAAAVEVVPTAGKRTRTAEPAPTITFKKPAKRGNAAAPAAPTDLRGAYDAASGAVTLTWRAGSGGTPAGYRVYRSDYPPASHRGSFLLLAGGKAVGEQQRVRTGDLVILSKEFSSFSRKQHISNRVWDADGNRAGMPTGMPFFPDEDPGKTWTLEPHGPDSPVVGGGRACLKLTLGRDRSVAFSEYKYGPASQSYYRVFQPGDTYVVEFWARQEGMADPTVTFKLGAFYESRIEPLRFTVGRDWQLFRGTFTIRDRYETGSNIGQVSLLCKGPGTIWLDNYRAYKQGTGFLDYTPEAYADIAASGMQALRTHAFIKTGTQTYSMAQLTDPAGATVGIAGGNTLPQTLAIMRTAGVRPWLQIEYHMSPAEWRGLVEYLAAPYDPATDTPASKPWAYKRFSQGQRKPWADEFPGIYFEIGNETWNWLFKPWVFEGMTGADGKAYDRGAVYGLFQEHVIDCLESSPYWRTGGLDRKVTFVLGGWHVNSYSKQAALHSPRSHILSYAAYNGGWDQGEGPAQGNDSSLFQAMIQAGQTGIPVAMGFQRMRDELAAEGRPGIRLGTYEAGPGYALSGLNGQAKMSSAEVRAQEETMKSLGAGTATLDSFLAHAVHGFDLQNFFTFSLGGQRWVSHRRAGVAHPSWIALELFNRHGTGDLLRVDAASVPTVDLPAFKRRKARPDVPMTSCYATRSGDRLNLFVLSRKIDGYPIAGDDGFTPVSVRLPFASARSVTLHRMAGDPRATNLDDVRVRIETVELPAATAQRDFTVDARTGADDRGLPPGATLLYVFTGIAP